MERIASYAGEKGITVVVEPTPAATNLIETADDASELMRSVRLSNVKVMFDTLHALYRNEISADYVRTMGKDLVHVHVSDKDRVLPGEGRVDWVGLMRALKDCEFEGYITMEIGLDSRLSNPDHIARTALNYLSGVETQLVLCLLNNIISRTEQKHTHVEWLRCLKQIDRQSPAELAIHIIADNYSAHKHPKVKEWLKRHSRFVMHFTPSSSSWLNLVERFFAELTEEVVREGSFKSVPESIAAIENYLLERNENPKLPLARQKARNPSQDRACEAGGRQSIIITLIS